MKGQTQSGGIITYFVMVVILLIFLGAGGYQLINLAGSFGSTAVGGTGVEAFIFNNLMLFIVLAAVLAVLVVGAWGYNRVNQ